MTDNRILEYIRALTNRMVAMQDAIAGNNMELFFKRYDEAVGALQEMTEEMQHEIGGEGEKGDGL